MVENTEGKLRRIFHEVRVVVKVGARKKTEVQFDTSSSPVMLRFGRNQYHVSRHIELIM